MYYSNSDPLETAYLMQADVKQADVFGAFINHQFIICKSKKAYIIDLKLVVIVHIKIWIQPHVIHQQVGKVSMHHIKHQNKKQEFIISE